MAQEETKAGTSTKSAMAKSAPTQNRDGRGDSRRGDGRRRTFSGADDDRQYDYEVLDIARVVRVVKGGRRFSFRATVILGDRNGTVGLGIGKSRDVQSAINKAYDNGVKRTFKVKLVDGTVPYDVSVTLGGVTMLFKSARPGTGIIAGGVVRLVADMVGIHDLVSKRLGSTNKLNTARAALKVLSAYKV